MLKVVHVGKFREGLPVGSPTDSFVQGGGSDDKRVF